MKNKTLKIVGLLVMLFCAFFLNACSAKIKVTKDNGSDHGSVYSRKYTDYICSSPNFGGGTTDDDYVVLRYIYENKELKEKYGDSFEVSDMGDLRTIKPLCFISFIKVQKSTLLTLMRMNGLIEIAYKYQFSSPEVFCRAFRKVWNDSPSSYKEHWRFSEIFPKIDYHYEEGVDQEMARKKVDITDAYETFKSMKGTY